MRYKIILTFLMLLTINSIFCQNNELIIQNFKRAITNIDSQEIEDVYIANSISKITENGLNRYYLDKKKENNIYTILFTTDDYLYVSDIKIEGNKVLFFTQENPIIRIENTFFGSGLAEEIESLKEKKVISTKTLNSEASFDINSETISYIFNQEKIEYDISEISDLAKRKNRLLYSNIKNSLNPIVGEEIKELYLSESCTVFKPEGQKTFSFLENVNNKIYQVIAETDSFYYILKVKQFTDCNYKIYTSLEPIKRISRNTFYDNQTENIFLDENDRLISADVLFTDADYNLEDNSFELIEGNYKVIFKLLSDEK
jgi:hypothetical protein